MPTPARIAEIQLECMADDVPPLDEMHSWSETAVTVYFESGGTTRPAEPAPASVASSAAPPKPRRRPSMPSWLAAEQRAASQAASSIEQAHHSQSVSCVRLWRDEDGSLGARGQLLAVSGSWDCAVRVWRVAAGEEAGEEAAGAAVDAGAALATLAVEGAERWVYDVMPVSLSGGGLAVVSAQTGGWAGEPQHLLRLWRVEPGGASRLEMLLNTEGADERAHAAAARAVGGLGLGGDPSSPLAYCHRRGVHALALAEGSSGSAGLLLSGSEELVAAWRVDSATGRGAEAARAASPLAGTPDGLLATGGAGSRLGSVVCAGRVLPGAGLPVLDLESGLTEACRLGFKADGACCLAELRPPGGHSPLVAAATPNRSLFWDMRSSGASSETFSRHLADTSQTPPRRFEDTMMSIGAPCLRLPLPGTRALCGAEGDPAALLAAAGSAVKVFDIRRLPADDPAHKKAPAPLARFDAPAGGSLECAAAMGGMLVAGDRSGDLHIWCL